MKQCPLCKVDVPEFLYEPDVMVCQTVINRIKRDYPSWSEHHGACDPCLRLYQSLLNAANKQLVPR